MVDRCQGLDEAAFNGAQFGQRQFTLIKLAVEQPRRESEVRAIQIETSLMSSPLPDQARNAEGERGFAVPQRNRRDEVWRHARSEPVRAGACCQRGFGPSLQAPPALRPQRE